MLTTPWVYDHTTWAAFGVGEQFKFPSHPSHYFIYWVGPCLAAILASTAYVIYAGGTVFGITLPTGLLKKKKVGAQIIQSYL
jgi:hypothetical protein